MWYSRLSLYACLYYNVNSAMLYYTYRLFYISTIEFDYWLIIIVGCILIHHINSYNTIWPILTYIDAWKCILYYIYIIYSILNRKLYVINIYYILRTYIFTVKYKLGSLNVYYRRVYNEFLPFCIIIIIFCLLSLITVYRLRQMMFCLP